MRNKRRAWITKPWALIGLPGLWVALIAMDLVERQHSAWFLAPVVATVLFLGLTGALLVNWIWANLRNIKADFEVGKTEKGL